MVAIIRNADDEIFSRRRIWREGISMSFLGYRLLPRLDCPFSSCIAPLAYCREC